MKDLSLKPGRYAVYATSGSGVVSIGEERYNLDSELLEDVKSRTQGAPGQISFGILYEESPRIEISAGFSIVVEGDEDFEISFVTH
jgi:hypothetical protein